MSGVYLYNSHSIDTPPGTVTSYLGTSDPDGWVICDGQIRTVTDDRFVNIFGRLNTMLGVTSNTANSITPPDLRSKVIYGAATISANPTTGGSENVTLTTANMPAHSHTITDPGHNHTISSGINPINGGGNLNYAYFNLSSAGNGTAVKNTGNYNTGITGTNNAGTGTAFSIMPPYYTFNYILKY